MSKVWKYVKIAGGVILLLAIAFIVGVLYAKKHSAAHLGLALGKSDPVQPIRDDLTKQAGRVDADLVDLHADNREALAAVQRGQDGLDGGTDLLNQLTDTNRRLADWIRSVQNNG